MPKSSIHIIKKNLEVKYPELSSDTIDLLITNYFNEVKQNIRNPKTPEITFMFGTLIARFGRMKKLVKFLNQFLKREENFLSEKKRKSTQDRYDCFSNLLHINQKIFVEGKTSRTYKRHLKRKFKPYKDEEL